MLTQLAVGLATLTLTLVFGYHIIIYLGARKHLDKLKLTNSKVKNSTGKRLPEITILVPTKGEPLDLLINATLAKYSSLKKSKCKGEILVVSDDEEEYLNILRRRLQAPIEEGYVRVVRRKKPKNGRTGALDYGARISKGEYILVLDSDSKISEQTLNCLCEKLAEERKEVVVIPWKGYYLKRTRLAEAVEFNTDTASFLLYKLRWAADFFVFPLGSGTAIRKDVLERIGFWGADVIQDDIWLGTKLAFNGYKPDALPEGNTEVLVPSKLKSFRIQQSRWAYGASEIFSRTFVKIIKSPLSLRNKMEMFMYVLQPSISIPLALATLIAFFAAFLEPGWGILHALNSMSILLSLGIAEGVVVVYAALHINIGKIVKDADKKITLIQMGRAAAVYGVLYLIIGFYSLLGLLRIKLPYKITPKGGAEETVEKDWVPVFTALISLIGVIASLLTINIVAFLLLLMPLISSLYAIIRLE